MNTIYFEDFHVGRTFRSDEYRIGVDRIKAFAAEFDPQVQHLDETAAASSQFGGLVASGWHTAALAMRLFIAALPTIPGGAIGKGVDELKWTKPVRPGDLLYVCATVIGQMPSVFRPQTGSISCEVRLFNTADELVLRFLTTMIVPRTPQTVMDELDT